MLELIFQGFIEWLYSLVLDCWNWISSSLLTIMSLDLAYIKSHVPIVTDIMQVLLAVGWALLLGNLVFQAMKGMAAGLGFEAEDPKMLFGRSAIFSFLLLASPQLCELVLDMTSKVIVLLELPNAVDVHLVDASILGNMFAGWLVVIIFNFIIMWKVLKLLLKIAEQYVVLSTLTIAAPLAFSMGGSKSTAPIFMGWCRMYGSMCLLMVSNVMFFKMLLSVMSAIPSGLDVIPWMVLILSIVKVAKRMDETITRIGLNPAMTGAPGGRSMLGMLAATVMHGAVSQVTKGIGGAAGTALKGVTGAGTAAAGAAASGLGGLGSFFRPGGGRNASRTSHTSNGQQTHSQQNTQQTSSQQESFQQGGGQPGTSQQNNFVQNGGNTSNTSSQFGQRTGGRTGSGRKTSVPPGTRRAPSYVPSPSGGNSTAPQEAAPRGSGFSKDKTGGGGFSRGNGFGTGTHGGGGFSTGRDGTFGSSSHKGGFGGGGRGSTFGSSGRTGTFGGGTRGGTFGGGNRKGNFGGGSRDGSFGSGTHTRAGDGAVTEQKNTERVQPGGAGTVQFSKPIGGASPAGTTPSTVTVEKTAVRHSGSPAAPQPGAAGTSVPPSATRSTRYQEGEKTVRQRTSNSGKPAVPGKTAPAGQSTQGHPTETRSTRREKVHSERTMVEHTAKRTSEQSGAAGTPHGGSVRQPGKAVPPAAGVSPPKRQGSSPAQQETRRTSVPGRPPEAAGTLFGAAGTPPTPAVSAKRKQSGPTRQERGRSAAPATAPAAAANPGKRPGPAGTAPDRSRAPGDHPAAGDRTERAKGKKPEQGMTPPGKRPGIGSAPPASKPQSGAKPPDRSGHSGGGGHGG